MRNETWNLPAPPGFRGLDTDKPIIQYERHLPHWRQDGATYFVTFRLADSLPQNKLHELRAIRREWEHRFPPPRTESQWQTLARETMQQAEQWLDQGMGSCALGDAAAADEMEAALRHFAGVRYELGCYVVMPNHVHLIVRPLAPTTHSLEAILKSWKSYTSRKIHEATGGAGTLWQEESHDRIVRDEPHLWECLQYVGRNPRMAQLPVGRYRLWVNPVWAKLGWKFIED